MLLVTKDMCSSFTSFVWKRGTFIKKIMIRRELRARALRTKNGPFQGLDILKSLKNEFAIAKANDRIGALTEQEQIEIDEVLESIRTSMGLTHALNQASGTSVAARAFEIEKFELQQEIKDLKNLLQMKSTPTKDDEQVRNLVRKDSSPVVKPKQTFRIGSVKETGKAPRPSI